METKVKERPILFGGAMVRALLDGTKTQTRRIAKHPLAQAAKQILSYQGQTEFDCVLDDETGGIILCPYGQPGERLWVRETFNTDEDYWYYRADYNDGKPRSIVESAEMPPDWKPSIHMPRAASRILLEITAVRCERLQDISEADAVAEGATCCIENMHAQETYDDVFPSARQHYHKIWASINGPGSWVANPWVWVVEFKRAEA